MSGFMSGQFDSLYLGRFTRSLLIFISVMKIDPLPFKITSWDFDQFSNFCLEAFFLELLKDGKSCRFGT